MTNGDVNQREDRALPSGRARESRLKWAVCVSVVAATLVAPTAVWATHRFSDVPDDSVHAPGIDYVAEANVTSGCEDGTKFCPSDQLTRDQMATFLHRQSGNAPGVAPSVNADTVDGLDAEELKGETGATGATGPAGAPGPAGPAGRDGATGADGGFGDFYNASTFTVSPSDCPEGQYRFVVSRQWGTALPWQPTACGEVVNYEFRPLLASTEVPAELFSVPAQIVNYGRVNGHGIGCGASPVEVDQALKVECATGSADGAFQYDPGIESSPVVFYALP